MCRLGQQMPRLPSARPHLPLLVCNLQSPGRLCHRAFARAATAFPQTHTLAAGLYSEATFSARPVLVTLYAVSGPCPARHALFRLPVPAHTTVWSTTWFTDWPQPLRCPQLSPSCVYAFVEPSTKHGPHALSKPASSQQNMAEVRAGHFFLLLELLPMT